MKEAFYTKVCKTQAVFGSGQMLFVHRAVCALGGSRAICYVDVLWFPLHQC